MRRDLCYYVEAKIDQVYEAYLNAATHKPFERDCATEPYHSISFGVNFSFKYNMNGGSCHLHFMPSGSGTAVNMRFSIAQAAGARYERYANDLNNAMLAIFPVLLRPANYDVEEFVKPENQVTPATFRPAAPPVVNTPPAQPFVYAPPVVEAAPATAASPSVAAAPAPQKTARACTSCGTCLDASARFCPQCGTPAPQGKVCQNCGAAAREGDRFCGACGTRLT